MSVDLNFFFSPKSVAVVGASPTKGKLSGVILDNLINNGFEGRVYPINPGYKEVCGLKCHPSIEAIGAPIDVAILAVSAHSVVDVVRRASGLVRGAIVVGGGFAEAGIEGERIEAELKKAARESNIRLIGPNCLGVFDPYSHFDTFFIPANRAQRPEKGRVAILTQSGSFAVSAMDELSAEGIGVSRIVSYGNMVDVDESECLDFLAEDERTSAIVLYVESIKDGRRFVEACRRVSKVKPVFALKAGKGASGEAATRSHTGAISGRCDFYRAAFESGNVAELTGYEDFMDACRALSAHEHRARGERVLIVTDGGGMGVCAADACTSLGLKTPMLDEATRQGLASAFPSFFSVNNPMDLTGSVTDEQFEAAIERGLSGPFDLAIAVPLWGPPGLTDALPERIAKAARKAKKPVLVCTPGGRYSRDKKALFLKHGLQVFGSPESVARGARAIAPRSADIRPLLPILNVKRPWDVLVEGKEHINQWEAHCVLQAMDVPVIKAAFVKDRGELVNAVTGFKYPLVLKVVSSEIAHKSEVGGVELNIRDIDDLLARFDRMSERLRSKAPSARIDGFLLEESAPKGVELLLSVVFDEVFGPVVALGSGGVTVELYRDVYFALGPLDRVGALALLKKTRAHALVDGFRGGPPMDKEALIEAIVRLSSAIGRGPIKEVEINPLIVHENGVVAVDARVELKKR